MDEYKLVSKVLVLDGNPDCYEQIKAFCDANNLVGLKVHPDNVMTVLLSNVDLGGILLSEKLRWSLTGRHPACDGHPRNSAGTAHLHSQGVKIQS